LNDLNHDGRLDGLEIAKGAMHKHDGNLAPVLSDMTVEAIVDGTLKRMDKDNDGYIDFAEYNKVIAQ
uniref:EF-hand domain-containing protein n=1 Tax=Heligmosomoides polygyrus TaxID=6339 RepID=A0A183F997_HELPZ